MLKEDLISVIIPVFNGENEIEKCIYNLMKQSYTNYEIIIINDGSTDNTGEICDRLKKINRKIQVIHQKNAGVSIARNVGIQKSKGKWIVFLDADDKMAPKTIEKALELAKDRSCDTVCWNCYKEINGIEEKYSSIQPNDKIYQKHELYKLIESLFYTKEKDFYPGQMFRAVWGKLLSAEIIKSQNILFPVNLPLGEDAIFLVDYFHFAKNVLLINEYWNYYKISPFSAVGRYRDNVMEIQKNEINLLKEKIKNEDIDFDTMSLNVYLQYNYQYVHNLFKKNQNIFTVYKEMLFYIKERKFKFKKLNNYDKQKLNKNSMPVVWAMTHRLNLLEALLCILREWKHN